MYIQPNDLKKNKQINFRGTESFYKAVAKTAEENKRSIGEVLSDSFYAGKERRTKREREMIKKMVIKQNLYNCDKRKYANNIEMLQLVEKYEEEDCKQWQYLQKQQHGRKMGENETIQTKMPYRK